MLKRTLEYETGHKLTEQMRHENTKKRLKTLEDQVWRYEQARNKAIENLQEEREALENYKKENRTATSEDDVRHSSLKTLVSTDTDLSGCL